MNTLQDLLGGSPAEDTAQGDARKEGKTVFDKTDEQKSQGDTGAGESGSGNVGAKEDQGQAGSDTQTVSKETQKTDAGSATAVEPLKWFNEKFKTSYEKEEDLATLLEKAKKAEELDGRVKEYESYREKAEELETKLKESEKKLNPLAWFKDENEFRAQQLKIKYPDKNPDVIQKVVGRDLKKVDDLEVLALEQMIDDPELSRTQVEAYLRHRYGLDGIDTEDLSDEDRQKLDFAKTNMRIDANKARKALSEFTSIDLPKFPTEEDIMKEAERQKEMLREKWTPPITKLAEATTLDIRDSNGEKLFEFEVPESTTQALKDYLETLVVEGQMEPDKDGMDFVIEQRQKEVVYRHLPEILKAYGNQIKSEVLKQVDEEDHNTKPPNEGEPPAGTDKGSDGFDQFIGNIRRPSAKSIG